MMKPDPIEEHFHLASTVGDDSSFGKISMENIFKQGMTSLRDRARNEIALSDYRAKKRPQHCCCDLEEGGDILSHQWQYHLR